MQRWLRASLGEGRWFESSHPDFCILQAIPSRPERGRYMTATKEQVFEQVREVLVDALGVDEEEVTGKATLMGDLGAESIDFLDIVFRLEKAFDIKIPREELFPAETLMNNHALVSNGKLTAKGLAALREKMPHTDISVFQNDPDINKLGDLFTVNSIVNYITSKLNGPS